MAHDEEPDEITGNFLDGWGARPKGAPKKEDDSLEEKFGVSELWREYQRLARRHHQLELAHEQMKLRQLDRDSHAKTLRVWLKIMALLACLAFVPTSREFVLSLVKMLVGL